MLLLAIIIAALVAIYFLGWFWLGAAILGWVAITQLTGLLKAHSKPEWYVDQMVQSGLAPPKPSWVLLSGDDLRSEMASELRSLTFMKVPVIVVLTAACGWFVYMALI